MLNILSHLPFALPMTEKINSFTRSKRRDQLGQTISRKTMPSFPEISRWNYAEANIARKILRYA